jgi:hypothetical protein
MGFHLDAAIISDEREYWFWNDLVPKMLFKLAYVEDWVDFHTFKEL